MASTSNNVFRSLYSDEEAWLPAGAQNAFWREAPLVAMDRDSFGGLSRLKTTVRSRWNESHLYVLFECAYETLHLKPQPRRDGKTWELWNWDVVELFIGDDWEHVEHYKEFELSPQGEWLDLAIDRNPPDLRRHREWRSGFETAAHVDAARRLWNGAMRIPFTAITDAPAARGSIFRVNLYRIEGAPEARKLAAWMATGSDSFHRPEAFGTLELV